MSKVKLCGMRREEDIVLVNRYLPDYIGFVFAPSKRRVTLEEARALKKRLNPLIKAVGVYVNAPLEEIRTYERTGVIECIQLHGDEDRDYVRRLQKISKLPIIQAIRVKEERDIQKANESIAPYVLLDKHTTSAYGGAGETFDWKLLKGMRRPYILAGGIGIENVKQALKYRPYCIDLSSKVETEGKKDEEKIKMLFEQLKRGT